MAELDNNQALQYTDANVNTFEFNPGVCILPIAEDPPTDPVALAAWSPVVVLRLHAPYRIRTHRYGAYKQNAPPVVPKPADEGAFVFIGGQVRVNCAMNMSLSLYDWDVNTQFQYVENCVSRPQDGMVLGVPPYTTLSSQDNSQIYGGALDIGTAASGGLQGAIRLAGYDAKVGYNQGKQVDFDSTIPYVYNSPSFFPGNFFSDLLANGGKSSTTLTTGG